MPGKALPFRAQCKGLQALEAELARFMLNLVTSAGLPRV